MKKLHDENEIVHFLQGKSDHTLELFRYFVNTFNSIGPVTLHATKTMIAISKGDKRIAWVTQLGKNFIHVVFPFKEEYTDNLCFTKVGKVPGSNTQYNHHFRMLYIDDLNEEVRNYMKLALK